MICDDFGRPKKHYQTVDDFMDKLHMFDFKHYLQSTTDIVAIGGSPNDDFLKQELSSSRTPDATKALNLTPALPGMDIREMTALIQARQKLDSTFVSALDGDQLISETINEHQNDLRREVLIRHGIQHMPEDDAKFLNQSLFRNNRDKNGFMKSSLLVKLSTTIISAWYDKAVEMYDPREPKFISSNDVLLKIQGWKKRTKQQMQQERESVLRQSLRGGSTEQEANTSSESSSQSKESSSSPEPCESPQVGSLHPTGDKMMSSDVDRSGPAVSRTQAVQDEQLALVPPNQPSGFSSLLQQGDRKVSQKELLARDYDDLSLTPPCIYSPQKNRRGQRKDQYLNVMPLDSSCVLDERMSASNSNNQFNREITISHEPYSYITDTQQPTPQIKRQYDDDQQGSNDAAENKIGRDVTTKKAKKAPKEVDNCGGHRSLKNEELLLPLEEPIDDYSFAWNPSQRMIDLQDNDQIGISGFDQQHHPQFPPPGFEQQASLLPLQQYQQYYPQDLPYPGQHVFSYSNIEMPYNMGLPAFGLQNHYLTNVNNPMTTNYGLDVGIQCYARPQPNMIPHFPPPGFTGQNQLALPAPDPASHHRTDVLRGERQMPEAMTRILPKSQKTNINDWTEEDCRSWIENLGFENQEDLEYLRGQRFTKFDFLLLSQKDDSRSSVYNMPRTIYSALLCNFNKVINMHNGHC